MKEIDLHQKFSVERFFELFPDGWEAKECRDFTTNYKKENNYINIAPFTDRYKADIYINSRSYPYPKTMLEFVNYCKSEGIELYQGEVK